MKRILVFLTFYLLIFNADGAVLRTGQRISYQIGDDGYYQAGLERGHIRDELSGIVVDNATGFMWQDDNVSSLMNWESANVYCTNLTLGGHSDWRIPMLKEFATLIDYGNNDFVGDSVFQYISPSYYWSFAETEAYSSYAWVFSFHAPSILADIKTRFHSVKCMRNINSPASVFSVRDDILQTVYDNATGLTWQDDRDSSVQTLNWSDAISYCENLNFAGQTDWRLPNRNELSSIIASYESAAHTILSTFQNVNPYINYWSSTTESSDPSLAWYVVFGYGNDASYSKDFLSATRCARGGYIGSTSSSSSSVAKSSSSSSIASSVDWDSSSSSSSAYVRDYELNVVFDGTTNLTWQDDSFTSMNTLNWEEAINYCKNLVSAGVNDWRLPNIDELKSILAPTPDVYHRITINSAFIGGTYGNYWSSTEIASFPSYAWGINFFDGTDSWSYMSNDNHARCVRNGKITPLSVEPNAIQKNVTLERGWNLITIPFNTDKEFDLSTLLGTKATIGWKFKFIAQERDEYRWDKWEMGTSLTLKNGEGLFVGIPSDWFTLPSYLLPFSAEATTNVTTFESKSYFKNKWYLLGFGYEIQVRNIKTLYPSSIIWVMEQGAYKKLNDSDVIKAGQGFWFKYQ